MTPARVVLERLLRNGERARSRGADEAVSIALTPASCHEYAALQTLDELETFHAEVALAARAGGIAADLARAGSGNGTLIRLRLASLDRLAAHLGIRLLSERTGDAASRLSPSRHEHPVIVDMLDAWSRGRKIRGHGPEAADDLVDAINAVDARRSDAREERLLRRESIRLFGDSKRLEKLTPWLELLVTGELLPSGLQDKDIWAALGLRREPQPMLLAGTGTVRLHEGEVTLVRPYLGLPVEAVQSIDTDARYLLSIENLASFHDAARALPDARGLLVYSAGMPSPAWRALYTRLLHSLPADAAVLHWGDIDEGGFRIAAVIAHAAATAGRTLQPWLMSPAELSALPEHAKPPSSTTLARMRYWARQAGWEALAAALEQAPALVEQEAIDPVFPA